MVDPNRIEIPTCVFVFTAPVPIENVAEVFPAGIVTVWGTIADVELLDTEITMPPVGAGRLIDTVPILAAPPFTEAGVNVRAVNVGPWIVKLAVWEYPPENAEIEATC